MREIKITMGDWLKNVGMFGLHEILKNADVEMEVNQDGFSFNSSVLENFSEIYFTYLIDKYSSLNSLNKILSLHDEIKRFEDEDYENFDRQSLEKMNDKISDVKKDIKSKSYISAYSLIGNEYDPVKDINNLKTIKLNKKDKLEAKLPEIKDTFNSMKKIINYFRTDKAKRYVGAKNTMYSQIKNAWPGVSILNSQVKEKNMYIEFQDYFVKPALEFLKEDNHKFKYRCYSCDEPMKNLKNDLSFMNKTGFDVGKKSSHVWDFNNDIAICPICKLIYASVPAGFLYLYDRGDRGIFINYNNDFKGLVSINGKVQNEFFRNSSMSEIFSVLSKLILEETDYELSDVQVIRFEKEKYTFNILNRVFLNTIRESKIHLSLIRKAFLTEGNTRFSIYEEVINNLYDNRNQFLLIHKMVYTMISSSENARYNSKSIAAVINININYQKEAGFMSKDSNLDIVRVASAIGFALKKDYNNKSSDGDSKKINSIAYKMLNALKTNNKHAFMDLVIKSYMYVEKPIPTIFSSNLKRDEEFKNIGYAFLTGFLGEEFDKKKEEVVE